MRKIWPFIEPWPLAMIGAEAVAEFLHDDARIHARRRAYRGHRRSGRTRRTVRGRVPWPPRAWPSPASARSRSASSMPICLTYFRASASARISAVFGVQLIRRHRVLLFLLQIEVEVRQVARSRRASTPSG